MSMWRVLAIVAAVSSPAASSVIVWDYSPNATGASGSSNWQNRDAPGFQSLAERVTFATGVALDGIDIYSHVSFGSLGQSVRIRVWGDNTPTSKPGALLLDTLAAISAIDTQGATSVPAQGLTRKHANLATPFLLGAGNFWVSMSGTAAELAAFGLQINPPGDNKSYQVINGTPIQYVNTGDLALRLWGAPVVAPAPGAIGLMGVGLLALASLRRRRFADDCR